ncbi:uncharacterized protein DUF4398 [Pseudomonas duriflava]|uniref:Uncharacterized protein DUF4398 n=1 Tax=Pseudomonas duriflava TaxID=459528 RepID=A0A562Q9I5_9PSED|nr:OmpA family protein [Pseudomonas duriflava]TWI53441.1 uncharacterized protein DUF4398 [Pseudomonas duriflava]
MKGYFFAAPLVMSVALLPGCASSPAIDKTLLDAQLHFDRIKSDSNVLRSAPKDVVRAEETLNKAKQLSGYWGSDEDVRHFAYLSQRYSDIAREHASIRLQEEQATQLQLSLEHLQLQTREHELRLARERGDWLVDQLLSLGTARTERGLVMTLGDVLFSPGDTRLDPSASETVLKLAQFLRINPKREVRIEGYTDDQGDDELNQHLSKQRANAVANALSALGIDPGRLQTVGYGEDYPVASNDTTEHRARNRRVEVVFSDESGNFVPAR